MYVCMYVRTYMRTYVCMYLSIYVYRYRICAYRALCDLDRGLSDSEDELPMGQKEEA